MVKELNPVEHRAGGSMPESMQGTRVGLHPMVR